MLDLSRFSRACACLVAFLIPVALVPWWHGGATSLRWIVASVSVYFVPVWLWPFVAFCFWKLGLDNAIHWAIICGAFGWGLRLDEIQAPLRCFLIAVGINSLVAIAQSAGWTGIPQSVSPAGLFVNKNALAEVAILAAAATRDRWALICLPAIVLPGSRTVFLAAFAGCCVIWQRWWLWLVFGASCAVAWFFVDGQRLMLWRHAVSGLSFIGSGDFTWSTLHYREPNVHNDFLQLAYSFGIVALVPLAGLGIAFMRAPVFVAVFAIVGSASFPLENPATAWLVAFVCGHAVGSVFSTRRTSLCSWMGAPILSRLSARS